MRTAIATSTRCAFSCSATAPMPTTRSRTRSSRLPAHCRGFAATPTSRPGSIASRSAPRSSCAPAAGPPTSSIAISPCDARDPVSDHAEVDAMTRALAALSFEHRLVLSLFAVAGLTHAEISETLGVPRVWCGPRVLRPREAQARRASLGALSHAGRSSNDSGPARRHPIRQSHVRGSLVGAAFDRKLTVEARVRANRRITSREPDRARVRIEPAGVEPLRRGVMLAVEQDVAERVAHVARALQRARVIARTEQLAAAF